MVSGPVFCGATLPWLFAGCSGSGEGTGSRSTVSDGCLDAGCGFVCACGVCGCWAHPPIVPAAAANHPTAAMSGQKFLLRRCIVPLAIMYRQRRKPRRRHESYLQFTPVPILLHLGWLVSDH